MIEEKKKSKTVTVSFTLFFDDPDPRLAKLAQIVHDGCPIDTRGLYRVKGKELALYAIEYLHNDMSKSEVKEAVKPVKIPQASVAMTEVAPPIATPQSQAQSLADMGLGDFID